MGDGSRKGAEDVDHNGNSIFDTGDALQVVWSDSWDDVADRREPTLGAIQTHPPVVHGKAIIGCDNYSTWNQVRPEVFDGGYAFADIPAGMYIVQACPPPGYLIQTEESLNVVFGDAFKPSKLALTPECGRHAGESRRSRWRCLCTTHRAEHPNRIPTRCRPC